VSPDITHAAVYANTANILIKRVNSTTWLELRWSALSNGRSMSSAAALFHPSSPTAIYAFELWCSHNASGTLATTRLATWDYTHVSSASVLNVPFNPTTDKAYLEAYLLDNVVSWALWINGYPGPIGTDNPARVESGSYAFGGGLATVIGSGVDGRPGFAMKVDNPPTESGVTSGRTRHSTRPSSTTCTSTTRQRVPRPSRFRSSATPTRLPRSC
jgi:hypothetical protein